MSRPSSPHACGSNPAQDHPTAWQIRRRQVRLSFYRANSKYGMLDHERDVRQPLPECLHSLLRNHILKLAKRDTLRDVLELVQQVSRSGIHPTQAGAGPHTLAMDPTHSRDGSHTLAMDPTRTSLDHCPMIRWVPCAPGPGSAGSPQRAEARAAAELRAQREGVPARRRQEVE